MMTLLNTVAQMGGSVGNEQIRGSRITLPRAYIDGAYQNDHKENVDKYAL